MSKLKTKELIICLVTIIALALVIATDVFAQDILGDLGNNAANNSNYSAIPDKTDTNNTANNTANKINNTVNKTNTNKNNTTPIPNTGIDYSIIFIVAVCGISAVYAYKKIRDYKNF